jgi:Putative prokaryotic signal transducing protein
MNNLSQSSPQSWVAAYTAHSEPEAIIVAGRLQNEGIETYVHREVVGGNPYGVYLDPLGEVTVLVHQKDFEQARLILEADVADDERDEEDFVEPSE